MRVILSGRLEIILSALLAVTVLIVGWWTEHPLALARDLLACVLAGCAVRWPRAASIALGVLLATFVFTPREWATLGEYSAMIPVLGAGILGQKRRRAITTAGYLVVLTALQYRDYPGEILVLYGAIVWAVLFAVMWLIGDVFTAYRAAQDDRAKLEVAQHRIALARDLHDTVMRSITRLSLQVQLAEAEADPARLRSVTEGLHQTATELRWMLTLLRDGDPLQLARPGTESLSGLLRGMVANLERRGFRVVLTTEGDLDAVPPSLARVLGAILDEAEANIERHAEPATSCAVIVSLGDGILDLVLLNHVAERGETSRGPSMGLVGARERLAPIGGELMAHQEGERWVTRVVVPVPATP